MAGRESGQIVFRAVRPHSPRMGNGVSAAQPEATTPSLVSNEENFELRSESRMFREVAVCTQVTIAVNNEGEVIAPHVDKISETQRIT